MKSRNHVMAFQFRGDNRLRSEQSADSIIVATFRFCLRVMENLLSYYAGIKHVACQIENRRRFTLLGRRSVNCLEAVGPSWSRNDHSLLWYARRARSTSLATIQWPRKIDLPRHCPTRSARKLRQRVHCPQIHHLRIEACDMPEENKSDQVDQRPLADNSASVNEALDDASTALVDDECVPSWSTPATPSAAPAKEEK